MTNSRAQAAQRLRATRSVPVAWRISTIIGTITSGQPSRIRLKRAVEVEQHVLRRPVQRQRTDNLDARVGKRLRRSHVVNDRAIVLLVAVRNHERCLSQLLRNPHASGLRR